MSCSFCQGLHGCFVRDSACVKYKVKEQDYIQLLFLKVKLGFYHNLVSQKCLEINKVKTKLKQSNRGVKNRKCCIFFSFC